GPENTRGEADDIDADESPVIVDPNRAGGQRENEENIRSEFEDLVQIRGTWASDEKACADIQPEGGDTGLYLTDTIIRWEGATCSIRDVDAEEKTASVEALCTVDGARRERNFDIELTGESTLSLGFQEGGQQRDVSLSRCSTPQ